MLQYDGHLARIAFAQNLRNLAVRMSGAEGDVEMVVARQAVSRHMDQGPPHHAAQRIFDHAIVAQARSEEHTSELQSLMRISYAVFCLKKKKKINYQEHKLQL